MQLSRQLCWPGQGPSVGAVVARMPHLDWDGGMLRWRLDLTVRPPPQVDPRLEAHGQPRPHPPQHRRPGHDQRVGVDPDGPRDVRFGC